MWKQNMVTQSLSRYMYIELITSGSKSCTYLVDYKTQSTDSKTLKVSARAIIKVSGHQHQWFPGVSQVVTM